MATLIEVIDREVTNPLLVAAENLELRQTGVYLENQATDRRGGQTVERVAVLIRSETVPTYIKTVWERLKEDPDFGKLLAADSGIKPANNVDFSSELWGDEMAIRLLVHAWFKHSKELSVVQEFTDALSKARRIRDYHNLEHFLLKGDLVPPIEQIIARQLGI